MYRSIQQLSQAKVMKKNAIFAFVIFVALMIYLIFSITPKHNTGKLAIETTSAQLHTP
ncbi:MAG: hypothetical protein J5I59_11470 [Saprospiraceae bacterium]|nr:hypothetical protein [Saprospiraceae bacterium]